jgi:tetratricopeptide (TPR) repeat protein
VRNDSGCEEEALALSERAAELFPQCGRAWDLVGDLLVYDVCGGDDRIQRAFECYDRAVACADLDASSISHIAYTHWRDGRDPARVEELFRLAVDRDPCDEFTLKLYAEFLAYARRDYKAAEELLRKALEIAYPFEYVSASAYTLLVTKIGDWELAEELAEDNRRGQREDGMFRLSRAHALAYVRGDLEGAEQAFREILGPDPSSAWILSHYLHFRMEFFRDYDFVEAELKNVLSTDARNVFWARTHVWLLLETGREAMALGMISDEAFPICGVEQDAETLMRLYLLRLNIGVDLLAKLRQVERHPEVGYRISRFGVLLERARAEGHPEMEWLPKLISVLRDEEPASILDAWPAWQAAGERGAAP